MAETSKLLKRLAELETSARALDPGPAARASLAHAALGYSERFLAGLPAAPAYAPPGFTPGAEDFPLTEAPADITDVLQTLEARIDTGGANPASAGYLAYVPGGGLYPSALGDFLADVSNRYAGAYFTAPGAVQLERALLRWMADLVGFPAGAGGDLTSGGSIATLSAIVAAREHHELRARDVPASVVYLTEQTHHCVDKALRVAGLRECVVRRVPTDAASRMQPQALAQAIRADRTAGLRPWLLVASAGTTDTGAVDPLAPLAEIARREGLWLHVDAAYGGFFLLTAQGRERLAGIEQADTVVMDPHKGLFLPFGTGALLARDERCLAAAFSQRAGYLAVAPGDRDDVPWPADLSPELSRPFRGLRLWLPLRLFGLRAFRDALEEKLLLARYFHEQLGRFAGFERGPAPELSIVTYRYRPRTGDADAFNRRLLDAVIADGRVFISSTYLAGALTLRFAALHFRTHREHVDELLARLQSAVARLGSP